MGVSHKYVDPDVTVAAGKVGPAEWNAQHKSPPWAIMSTGKFGGGNVWSGMPAAESGFFFDGLGQQNSWYVRYLFQYVNEFRFQVNVNVAGAAGSKLFPVVSYWRADLASFVQERISNVLAESEVVISATGLKDTGWKAINANLKLYVPTDLGETQDDATKGSMVQINGSGGDGAASPSFGLMLLQVR